MNGTKKSTKKKAKATRKPATRKRRSGKKTKKRNLLIFAGLCLALFLGGLILGYHYYHHQDVVIDSLKYPVQGIDVSRHNGDIDFNEVAQQNIQFVIMRASHGDKTDEAFEKNYAEATAAGLEVGVYHYLRFDKDGAEQARILYDCIKGKTFAIPVAVDVEDWGNSKFIEHKKRIKTISDMVTTLKQLGVNVMIYTNQDGHKKYVAKHFEDETLWLCALIQPETVPIQSWKILQYCHTGTVKGIEGDVDLDIFNGTQNEWKLWLDNQK